MSKVEWMLGFTNKLNLLKINCIGIIQFTNERINLTNNDFILHRSSRLNR